MKFDDSTGHIYIMEYKTDLIFWLKANKNRSWEEATIRQLLAAQMPETTDILVRSALWNTPGSSASTTLTPSKYEEILKCDLFLTVRCLSDCTVIEPNLATEIANALAAICLDGEDWYDLTSPIREKAWGMFAYVRKNNIGTQLFAQLLQALRDERTNFRLNAAKALGRSGQNVDSALEVVNAILQHSDTSRVKVQAANAVKMIGRASEDIIALLIATIKKDIVCRHILPGSKYEVPMVMELWEGSWRRTAVKVLGSLGQSAKEAVPALLDALQNTDYYMRQGAASALGAIGESSDEVELALISGLTDFDHDGSFGNHGVAEGLGKLAAISPSLQATVLALLQNENHFARSGAAEALGYVFPVSDALLNSLFSVTQDQHWLVRYQSLAALARIGKRSIRIMDIFLNALNDPNSSVSSTALSSLGTISPLGSEKGKLALLNATRDPRHEIRRTAAWAFGHLGDTSEEVVFALQNLLAHEETAVEAATTLVQLGKGSIEATHALLRGLQDENEETRHQAAEAMAGLPATSSEVEKGLVAVVHEHDGEISFAAWQSLWTLMQRQNDNLLNQK